MVAECSCEQFEFQALGRRTRCRWSNRRRGDRFRGRRVAVAGDSNGEAPPVGRNRRRFPQNVPPNPEPRPNAPQLNHCTPKNALRRLSINVVRNAG